MAGGAKSRTCIGPRLALVPVTMMRLAALVTLGLTGCMLYSKEPPPPTPCPVVNAGVAPSELMRDPSTGVCQSFGGGCPVDACGCDAAGGIWPNWPSCFGPCEGLDEHSCVANPACHAAYTEPGGVLAGDALVRPTFSACWDIGPLPVETGGTCAGFDAWTCAAHADCVSVLTQLDTTTTPSFQQCAPEVTPLDPGSCDPSTVACDGNPPACPTGTVPGVANGCWSGYCIPVAECPDLPCDQLTTESACLGRTDCAPTYTGTDCTCDAHGVCTCQTETFASCGVR